MEYIKQNKQKHMFGVAEFMAKHAAEFDCNEEEMYVLGLLHDIGYIYGQKDHARNGSNLMFELGYKDCNLIAWHEMSPAEYKKSLLVEDLPKKLLLLLTADLSVNAVGEDVGFDARLEEIKRNYGEDSIQFQTSSDTISYLRKLKEDKDNDIH